jgi:hypothetical protein
MGLQVRLRHALGERVLDLPERDVAQPWVFGRGNEADVKVPSVGVAPRHAALFVHDGRWVVQGCGGLVTLNGEPLEIAAALRPGDVVGLGCEDYPPTLEISPGVAEGPRSLSGPRETAQPASVPRPVPAPAPAPVPTRLAPVTRPQQPREMAGAAAPSIAADDPDTIEWDPQTPAPTTTEFYVPKGRQTPVGLIVAATIIGVAALVGVAIVAYQKAHQPAVVVVQAPDGGAHLKAKPEPQKAPMFDIDADQAAARQDRSATPAEGSVDPKPAATSGNDTPGAASSSDAPAPASDTKPPAAPEADSAPPPASSPQPSVASTEDPPDPDDPEWHEIEQAHFNVRHQGVAIVKYDEYRRAHPGKFTPWLDQYTDEAVNWLYWQRVAQLWKQRDDLTAEVKQKEIDLRNQPTGAFHEELVKDKADLDGRVADATKKLTEEMAYTADTPPDLEKPSELRKLSAKRDAEKYAAFKKRVLKYVRDHHGSVWWEGE